MAEDGKALVAAKKPSEFVEFLKHVEDGNMLDDLDRELLKLVAKLRDFAANVGGKPKGALRVTIGFHLDGGVFDVRAKIDTKLPELPRNRSMFYPSRTGGLSPNNPGQLDVFASPPVDRPTLPGVGEVRSVSLAK